ncbi:ras-like GTP-binding protein RhoL [Phlebotomus papatasi]|uniref:ras-like GTP-binding protein RhoL n=1 Tax=Phlebotomus papatasi TaxID=29031 RepID=UPI002483801F|nr:ras-like GTP-binding protein RhoL [Phlebotomus papatasi]
MMSLNRNCKHIVVVGDGRVGKTTFLFTYINDFYQESFGPTIYDRKELVVNVDGQAYWVQFHDTAGQEDYEMASSFAYDLADAIILCYSIPKRISFENISQRWIHKLNSANKDAPFILVGTKFDIKTPTFVSSREGKALAKKIGANKFIECSAKTQKNINEVIHEAVRAAIVGKIQNRKTCMCWS